jgi:transposase
MEIEVLGIDLAKNVFQLHGIDRRGRAIYKRRVFREQLLSVVGDIPRCTVIIEACTGAFYWARQFEALGHRVTIISPQYVKPFVRRQKNDGNDAEAIVTAARQPHIPHVPKKTIEQQDVQALHRVRRRMVNHRTAVVSQIRGLLLDRGFAFAKSITRARRVIPVLLSDMANGLTTMAREAIAELWDLMCDLESRLSTRRLMRCLRPTQPVSGSLGSKALDPRRLPQWSLQLAMGLTSRTDVTWPPGWG